MEKNISPVLVVNNANLKPYIEIFTYYPENIVQKTLGILAGFFEIRDYSEDSAYIVNFLNSVLKKEYYLNPKRSVQDSFDNALHKTNIALSELAKHGNINWLRKLDSAICVFEKNSFHFAVTGKAKILLWRNESLTDITDGLYDQNEEVHPLKTFTNVSSGRLEKNDRLIVASSDVFNILSLADIRKGLIRFDHEKFTQFLKTAMGNELEVAGSLVVELAEPQIATAQENHTLEETEEERDFANAFSSKTFHKTKKKKTPALASTQNETLEEKEYTDSKTGHIYIQDDGEEKGEESPWNDRLQIAKERFRDAAHSFLSSISSVGLAMKKKLAGTFSGAKKSFSEKISVKKRARLEKNAKKQEESQKMDIGNTTNFQQNIDKDEFLETRKASSLESIYSIIFKIKLWVKKTKIRLKNSESTRTTPIRKFLNFFPTIPSFRKIFQIFSKMKTGQKISAAIIVTLMVALPLGLNYYRQQRSVRDLAVQSETPPEPSEKELYANDKNIVFVEQVEKISAIENGIAVFVLEQGTFLVTNRNVTQAGTDAREYAPAEENDEYIAASYMKDLGLILLVSKNRKAYEFSPKLKSFKNSAINIPENAQLGPVATYLTYLYVTDKGSGQIYRYPRAEGGFGGKNEWLKEKTDFSWAQSMTIDENLYLAGNGSIRKYFRGNAADFTMENSATPISFDMVYTEPEIPNIFVLDRKNSRLAIFSKEGSLIKQFHHEAIASAKNFSVDTTANKAYILTGDELDSMVLE